MILKNHWRLKMINPDYEKDINEIKLKLNSVMTGFLDEIVKKYIDSSISSICHLDAYMEKLILVSNVDSVFLFLTLMGRKEKVIVEKIYSAIESSIFSNHNIRK